MSSYYHNIFGDNLYNFKGDMIPIDFNLKYRILIFTNDDSFVDKFLRERLNVGSERFILNITVSDGVKRIKFINGDSLEVRTKYPHSSRCNRFSHLIIDKNFDIHSIENSIEAINISLLLESNITYPKIEFI